MQPAVRRLASHLLLTPGDLSASRDDFETVGAFNPGVVRCGNDVVMLVRVAERPRERRADFTALPRWDAATGMTIDWIADSDLEVLDPRVVMVKATGTIRLTFISHLRVVRCGDGRSVDEVSSATLAPSGELDEYGVEDPRISFINGRYYITYVSVSRHGAATCLASTTDFEHFERHGVIFCPENKDVTLLPEKVDGHFVALHRPVGGTQFTRPEMWIARSPDLIFWGAHEPLNIPSVEWQSGRVGGGVPPIRVPGGFLTIYHGNMKPTKAGEVGAYFGGALLLDEANPAKVLGCLPGPLLAPEEEFETTGFVGDVVFPTGVVQDADKLLVYYGAADACTGVAEFSLGEILDAMVAP